MKNIWRRHSAIFITYMIAVLLLVFVSIARPGYGNIDNLNLLAVTMAILGITSLGQTFVVLTGGMDLSIPWMFTISAFMMAGLSRGEDQALIYVIPFVLLVGLGMGLLNGVGVAYVGIAPVIMTISTNIIFQGLLLGVTGGLPGGAAPQAIKDLALGTTFGVANLFLIWLAVSAFALLIMFKTRFGRNIYSVGSNETVALFSGVNTRHVKLAVFAISGLMAALGGVLYAGRLGQLYLGMGEEYQMQTVATVAIGGVSLSGGKGSYAGTMAGVFIIVILTGFLTALNIHPNVQKIVYGVVLFVAVLLSLRKTKVKRIKTDEIVPETI